MPTMPYAQYMRIESIAGGICCTPREFIRAAHTRLAASAKKAEHRAARHAWIRDGLRQLRSSRSFVAANRL